MMGAEVGDADYSKRDSASLRRQPSGLLHGAYLQLGHGFKVIVSGNVGRVQHDQISGERRKMVALGSNGVRHVFNGGQ